jgi:hypothetical protein
MSEALHCRRCGEVIGVYEPLVRVLDGCAQESSRAVEGFSSDRANEHYHCACYALLSEEAPTDD